MIAWLTTDGNFIAVNRAFASVTGEATRHSDTSGCHRA